MDFAVILAFAGALPAGGLALSVAWQERRSLAHWAFVLGMVVLATESLFSGLSADALLPENMVHWQNWRLVTTSFLPGIWLFFSLTYARGNYREFLAKWRFLLLGAFLIPVGLAVGLRANLITSIGQTPTNGWILKLGAGGFTLYLFLLLSAVLVLMNLERTFRAAVGTMRWRIKFMILGLGLLFAVRAYTSSQVLLFRSVSLSLEAVNSAALLMACLLVLRSLFRTGHFDQNVYPSHSVLHNSFTVMLAGIYLLIVGVLAKVVAFLGGDATFALKSFVVLVGLVLLTMVLLSDRVRLYARRFVSRHFQRPLYDYRTIWRTFTEGTARCVEQADLCSAITKLVSQVFQALSVTVWLRVDGKEKLTFAASTSLSDTKAAHLALDAADASQVISALSIHPDPVDLDSCKETWASALRRLHPGEFRKGGNRVCVPMLAGGELLGIITLGDRVGGVPFSLQDFDLLRSVSDQAAASLLNIQLSQRLSQGKQLEAFQAMSAFFVHDLKNTASTLSLMLQNLPVHFQDPKFRQDALRGVSKTVNHINDLISRLGLLRQELTISTIESDLNELVTAALKGLARGPAKDASIPISTSNSPISAFSFQLSDFTAELHPLPKVHLDPAQIQNVVTNLVLNAREAVGPDGQIKIETSQRNGSVILTVTDNGCGMTPEFVERSLFRPFQTTKKQGIGIGMFQCKTIVEAHRGRIEVDSEPGKGTTFRIFLPADQKISDNT